jgi:hypothetical protein
MCREKVVACAALYGNNSDQECKFDSRGHLDPNYKNCGLASLLDYVSTVDSLNAAEKCGDAIDEYVEKLCTPSDNSTEFPYQCKGMKPHYIKGDNMSLPFVIQKYAYDKCHDASATPEQKVFDDLDQTIKTRVATAIAEIRDGVRASLAEICEELDGAWYSSTGDDNANGPIEQSMPDAKKTAFYNQVSGRGTEDQTIKNWGTCYEKTIKLECLAYNNDDETNVATWNATTEDCEFTDAWYKARCEDIGGYYEGSVCYIR